MQDFHKLTVWEKAHALTLEIYRVTNKFPNEEKFGLVSQMRRSAASIPTNIAEGCVRSTDADFARFLYISLGSTSELEYQLLLAKDLAYLDQTLHEQIDIQLAEVKRMLVALIKKLTTKNNHPHPPAKAKS